MVYLTNYIEYPIYYPEEGGFYVAGQRAGSYYRLNSVKQAKRKLEKSRKELEEDGFVVRLDGDRCYVYKRSRYIGDGESWIIEKVYGSHERGYEPYC